MMLRDNKSHIMFLNNLCKVSFPETPSTFTVTHTLSPGILRAIQEAVEYGGLYRDSPVAKEDIQRFLGIKRVLCRIRKVGFTVSEDISFLSQTRGFGYEIPFQLDVDVTPLPLGVLGENHRLLLSRLWDKVNVDFFRCFLSNSMFVDIFKDYWVSTLLGRVIRDHEELEYIRVVVYRPKRIVAMSTVAIDSSFMLTTADVDLLKQAYPKYLLEDLRNGG